MDDMNGTNWTALTQAQGGTPRFSLPAAVAVDSAGKIYVADNGLVAPAVVRVDDMTGANWTTVYVSPTGSTGLNSISVDASQAVFTGGGGAKLINEMIGVLTSSGAVAPYGTYYVFGVTPVPLPSPVPSAISLTPASLTFSQNVGTTSPAQTITAANFGGSPLNFSGITAGGAFAQTNNCPAQLQAGSNCTISVTFRPTATGTTTGTLTVNDDSYNLGTKQSAALNGTGTAPAATVTATSLSFGSQVEGTTSQARNVTLKNSGSGPMQVTSITAPAPYAETDTCSGTILAGSSCSISVTFAPTSVRSFTASLTISDNAGTQTVNLSGSGSAAVTLSANSVSFGSVVAGNTSAARTVTLTNHTSSTLTFSGITTASPFAISSNTCGSGIAGLANCKVGVTFTPQVVGSLTGTLTFTDTALNSPQTVKLSGTSSAPVTFSVSSLNFGWVKVGTTSLPKNVTVTNRSSATITFTSIAPSASFSVSSNTCGSSLAAGASCTVGITFSPTATGTVNGTLTLTDSAVTSPQTLTLTGTGS
jgi:hypothetical protein